MRKGFATLVAMLGCLAYLNAQTTRDAIHLAPNGKGWGVERKVSRGAGASSKKPATANGISYHGGPVMRANSVNVYFIWYGNWTNGPKSSDSQTTVSLMDALF